MFVLLQFPAKAISMVYEQLNHRYSKFNQNCCEVYHPVMHFLNRLFICVI